MLNVAIVGCGAIGQKRAQYLGNANLVACVDSDFTRAQALAARHPDCSAYPDLEGILARADVHIVLIATLHASLAEIALAATKANKHIFIEKPAARTATELDALIECADRNQLNARVGFNHRYHRAFRKARALVDADELGELMFIRARYGHGGRMGYDKEWRANPALSGGGELIDQGIHLIDLARWFLGEFTDIHGYSHTYFWEMPVDDNSFLLLKTADKKVAHLHASCTEWKNTFSFEIYGRNGKIDINGLGGSYGVERLSFYKMRPTMGPPDTTIWEYPMQDDSWEVEFKTFVEDIQNKRASQPGLKDAQAALHIVEEIYRMSRA